MGKLNAGRACDFNIPTGTPYDKQCQRPGKAKWHAGDDEVFCDVHKDGVPDGYESEAQYNKFWSTR